MSTNPYAAPQADCHEQRPWRRAELLGLVSMASLFVAAALEVVIALSFLVAAIDCWNQLAPWAMGMIVLSFVSLIAKTSGPQT